MKTVIVKKVEAYIWECPECGGFNMVDKEDTVICNECANEFKVKEEENKVDMEYSI